MWSVEPLASCVKMVATEKGSDYFDAIHLSNMVCEMEGFFPEGGAKNVARRDGMGTTVLSAVTTIGSDSGLLFSGCGERNGGDCGVGGES